MNRPQKSPTTIARHPAWRRAIQRLQETLEQNAPPDNSEKIRLMRLAMFGNLENIHIKLPN